jgi:hypothetical protein
VKSTVSAIGFGSADIGSVSVSGLDHSGESVVSSLTIVRGSISVIARSNGASIGTGRCSRFAWRFTDSESDTLQSLHSLNKCWNWFWPSLWRSRGKKFTDLPCTYSEMNCQRQKSLE